MWPSRAGRTATFRFPNLPAPLGGIVAFTGTDLLTWPEKLTNCRALILPWLMSLPHDRALGPR